MPPRPTPQDYGLLPDDAARFERLKARLEEGGVIFLRGIVAGFCTFNLLTAMLGSADDARGVCWIAAYFAFFFGMSVDFVRPLVEKLQPKLVRYGQFQQAVQAFETAQKLEEERALRARREFWQSLSGHAFERELAALLERAGFEVTRTPGSRDGGIDLFLRQDGRTTAVQCKQTKNPVGPGVARDLYGALQHCGADQGILAVTGGVTSGVIEFFAGKPLRVMGLTEILALQEATRNRP